MRTAGARTVVTRNSRAITSIPPCAEGIERIHCPDASRQSKAGIILDTGICSARLTMILSMTGFAGATAELPGISLAVELRSVNHRYLDVTIKLPDELRTLETAIRERIAGAQRRGKVECRVAMARTRRRHRHDCDQRRARPSARRAPRSGVARAIPGTPPLDDADILRWPGVMVDAIDLRRSAGRAGRSLRPARAVRAHVGARARGREAARRARCALRGHRRTAARASRRAFRRCTPRTWTSSAPACVKRGSSRTTIA